MLIPPSLKLGLLLASHALVGWFAWEWRDRAADAAEASQQAAYNASLVQQQVDARAQESKKAQDMATIGANHEKDREAAQAVPDAVVAELRAGNLRLRDDLATCHTASLSQAAASASQRDASAQLNPEVVGAAFGIAQDADDQLRACQAVVKADREQSQ